eukprot:TRINITY_DN16130_c2_g1_i1.p1 TRINITY_DN16130_c2_g1~~TRINITY_DN16130_c2_g1_i1.p1  ORF type:complete len:638 (-),score=205.83 TRINITY_DN16130_c2_g1_i1:204-2117(-)
MLVPKAPEEKEKPEEESEKAVEEKSKEEGKGEEAEDGDDEGEEEEDGEPDEEVGEGNVEAESRSAFLTSASTPELLRQAVAVGGALGDSTKDRWVLDRATQLHFKYDSPTEKIYCWNPGQGCMYSWQQRGKMTYLWASPSGPSDTPPSGPPQTPPQTQAVAKTAADSSTAVTQNASGDASSEPTSLLVTVIPPQVLVAGGIEDPKAQVEEEMELATKAMGAIIGKGGASIKEIEKHSGAKISAIDPEEGDPKHLRKMKLSGTKAQIVLAKSAIEQRVALVLGHKAAEKMQKVTALKLLEQKKTESGADAAKLGVKGLSEFAQENKLKAVMGRKLSRLDAMLQRYMIRHFEPKKAKPENALKGYLLALLKHPQKWRLEALYEDGELDGEICETVPIQEGGAAVGRERSTEEAAAAEDNEGQLIELEVDRSLDPRQASKVYGDVQPQHCRFMRMGQDFYSMALESQIGTVVDGHKYREQDGPVPIRDGSVLQIGKYLLYCEVGTASSLQGRRKRLLEGERFWREGSDAVQRVEQLAAERAAAEAEMQAEEAAARGIRAAVAGNDDGDGDVHMAASAAQEDSDDDDDEKLEQLLGKEDEDEAEAETEEATAETRKRKREDEDEEIDAMIEAVEELPDVGQ